MYGLACLLGASLALNMITWPVCALGLLFLLPLTLSGTTTVRFGLALCCCCVNYYLTLSSHQFPSPNDFGKTGTAELVLNSVSTSTTPFGKVWKYKGTLVHFINAKGETVAKNIPIRLTIPSEQQRPLAGFRYFIKAKLKETSPSQYGLTIPKQTTWEPIEQSWNPAEWRYKAKTALQEKIKSSIKDKHVAAFLSGMATGEMDDLPLANELGRFGLQHLMAISGLHFSILASIIALPLCLLFSIRKVAVCLILLLSAYFFFLGSSPSVLRAWISLVVALGGTLLCRQSSGLNSLGLGLLVICLWDPTLIRNIGFQFSFGITAAILIWFAPCDLLMQKLLMKRSLSQMASLHTVEQHAYCLLCFLRQTLALALAVNLIALPMTLYHFHQFPLLGFVYNLFFPFLITLSMLLLLAACCLHPVLPWVGEILHKINEHYTGFLLNFTFNLPKTFDSVFRINNIQHDLLIYYIIIIYVTGIYIKQAIKDQEYLPEWMAR